MTIARGLQALSGYIAHVNICQSDSEQATLGISRSEDLAPKQYAHGSLQQDLLASLIHFNISRSLVRNTQIIKLSSQEMHDNAILRFCTLGPKAMNGGKALSLPPSLQPTELQEATLHHLWFDIIPVANMRNNLISAGEAFHDRQLCRALRGLYSDRRGNTGVKVWLDSWDPSGWELTESFARDWGRKIPHCDSLFESTNHWRSLRGERPLFRTRTGSILHNEGSS